MIRFHLYLNCDGPGCEIGVEIQTLDFGGNAPYIAEQLRGWTQDSKNPNDHYCPECSQARPAAEQLRSQFALENLSKL